MVPVLRAPLWAAAPLPPLPPACAPPEGSPPAPRPPARAKDGAGGQMLVHATVSDTGSPREDPGTQWPALAVKSAAFYLNALGGLAAGVKHACQPQHCGVQAATFGAVVAASCTLHGRRRALRSTRLVMYRHTVRSNVRIEALREPRRVASRARMHLQCQGVLPRGCPCPLAAAQRRTPLVQPRPAVSMQHGRAPARPARAGHPPPHPA